MRAGIAPERPLPSIFPQVAWATRAGLEQYRQSLRIEDRQDASLWPRLTISLDQESSGICGVQFLERVCSMNIEKFWDFSHSNWRDIICALKSVSLWGHCLLALIAYNVPHGPWADDMRLSQCKASMEHLFATEVPTESPLWLSLYPQMIEEGGHHDTLQAESPEQALWHRCRDNSPWANKGHKCVVNRFMGMRRRAAEESRVWSMRSFSYQYTCLECGFYKGARFNKLVVLDEKLGEPDGGTASRKLTNAEKCLRSACQNCLVVGSLFYADEENKVKQSMLWVATEPLDKWHGQQSRQCRSTSGTKEFLLEQLDGGFLATLASVLQTCQRAADLVKIGFSLPTNKVVRRPNDGNDLNLLQQDSWATLLGRFVCALVGHRLRRMSYFLRSWPVRSTQMLLPGAKGEESLDELLEDLRAFEEFQKHQHMPAVKALVDRSIFSLVSTQQLVKMCENSGWALRPALIAWLHQASEKNISTVLCEDGFQRQKGKVDKQNNHQCRAARAFGTLLEMEVMGVVHDYSEVRPDELSGSRVQRISAAAYKPPLKGTKVEDMHRIIGATANSRPFWYSPGVEQLPVEHIDLEMMRWCVRHNKIAEVGHAWMGCLLRAEHSILVRTKGANSNGNWVFPLLDTVGTCSLVWPAKQFLSPDASAKQFFTFNLEPPSMRDIYLPVVDLSMFEAIPVRWRSPLSLARDHPTVDPSAWLVLGVVCEVTGPAEPLLTVAARHAFWSLGVVFLGMLARHLQLEIPNTRSLFEVCYSMVQQVLHCNDKDCVSIMAQRMGNDSLDSVTELMELDEAYEVLDFDERTACDQMKTQMATSRSEAAAFRKSWSEKRALVLAPPPTGRRSAKAKAKANPSPKVTLPHGELAQADLRARYCPAGGHIWKNNGTSGGWQAHYPPFRRVSFAGSVHGARRSAVLCLRYLWDAWCTVNGKSRDEVPVANLWRAGDVAEDGSLVASAASTG